MSLTAAQCARTLIIASASGNQALRQCTKLLLPGLIEFTAKVSPSVLDNTITENLLAALGEVWKAFSGFLTSVPEDLSKEPSCHSLECPLMRHRICRNLCAGSTTTDSLSFAAESGNVGILDRATGVSGGCPAIDIRFNIAFSIQRSHSQVRARHSGHSRTLYASGRRRVIRKQWVAEQCETANIVALFLARPEVA